MKLNNFLFSIVLLAYKYKCDFLEKRFSNLWYAGYIAVLGVKMEF